MQYPGFIDGSYNLPSVMAGVERSVNMYPEIDEGGHGKNKMILQGTPGLSQFCDLSTGKPIRFLDSVIYSYGGDFYFYAISGTGLFQINVLTGAFSNVGTVSNAVDTSPGSYQIANPPAVMANGIAVGGPLLTAGGHAYTLSGLGSASPAVTDLTDTGGQLFGNDIYATSCAFLDGYFLVCDGAHGTVYFSASGDSATWNLLDYFQPLGFVERITVAFGELWCQSVAATEVYYNSGNADTPFTRIPGSRNNQALGGLNTIQQVYNSLIWVGADSTGGGGMVYQATSYVPTRISTHAVEEALSAFIHSEDVLTKDILSWVYTEKGHAFYVLSFGDSTWVYDCHTTRWHERAYSTDGGVTLKAHLGRCHTYLNQQHLVGSRVDGKIYVMGDQLLDDAGIGIYRLRQAPHLQDEARIFTYHNFQLDMDSGIDTSGPPPTKTMSLSWANDGGKVFTTPLTALIGSTTYQAGARTRVLWRRLGSARDRVFRVTSVAAVRHTWTDAFINNLTD